MPSDFERLPPPEPEVIRTLYVGQAVLWHGERMVIAVNHPFRGIRLQAPSGGPTFYADRFACQPIDEDSPAAPVNGAGTSGRSQSGRS